MIIQPISTDRDRSGRKHCVLADAVGVPLAAQTAAANQREDTAMLPMAVNLPGVAVKRGRQTQAGYERGRQGIDDKVLRGILRWLGIEPILFNRGDDALGLG